MILVNGSETDRIAATDRGLAYGDGLFETLAVRDGAPLHWGRHMARLARGCGQLGLPPPDEHLLHTEAQRALAGGSFGALKIIMTRGSGPRGYRPPPASQSTRVVMALAPARIPADWHTEGLRVRLCRTRLSRNPLLAGIKHLNRLEQVLARSEWQDEFDEGIMLDTENHVVEATMSNLFLIRDEGLRTPLLDTCGVAGITRERVMEAARGLGLSVQEDRITVADLATADGMFLTGTLMGICPVRELDLRPMPQSPLTRRLQQALESPGP